MGSKNRRQFLEESMLAAATAAAATTPAIVTAQETQSKSPNEKLGVAVVGVRGRGGSHIGAFAGRQDTEILYICDADRDVGGRRAEEARQQRRRPPRRSELGRRRQHQQQGCRPHHGGPHRR